MDSLLRFFKFMFTGEKERQFTDKELDDVILLGKAAESALDNPAIILALTKIEEEITRAWKLSAPKDEEAREKLYYRIEGLNYFKAKLQGMVNNMIFETNKAKRQAGKAA